jgi:undecaprenyl diphosphate synthase
MSIIDKSKLPSHIAIIMDGNGRWAKNKGKARVFGHKNGVESVRQVTEGAAELGVQYLTLYAFSTENWNRPKAEVTALMTLLVATISKETKTLNKNNIRLHAIGNLENLPKSAKKELLNSIEKTSNNTGLNLILALSYSSKWEITQAMTLIAQKVKEGTLSPENISEKTIQSHLSTAQFPDPELLIRTSGEHRISNFLLWQIAYSELYFTPTLWPDFRKADLEEAILSYQQRERRFGKTSEQLETPTNA